MARPIPKLNQADMFIRFVLKTGHLLIPILIYHLNTVKINPRYSTVHSAQYQSIEINYFTIKTFLLIKKLLYSLNRQIACYAF